MLECQCVGTGWIAREDDPSLFREEGCLPRQRCRRLFFAAFAVILYPHAFPRENPMMCGDFARAEAAVREGSDSVCDDGFGLIPGPDSTAIREVQ